jgi:LacI family transcriptional regulator
MKTRVTQNDIARVAGVHNTTVSLALRNSPAIPEPTRKRIQAIAEEMGYYPDPALQALVAYRNGRMPARRQETLAYVTNWYSKWGWQDEPASAKFYAGAQRKAAECGFQLEHFWLGEPGMSPRRLNSMLFHRGITGVVLASHRPDCDELAEVDWSRLSAIKIGCFPHSPALNRVVPDQSSIMRQAMKRIISAGYQRIGFIAPREWDDLSDQASSAGFLAEQCRLPAEVRIPILYSGGDSSGIVSVDDSGSRGLPLAVFEKWYRRHQPEVLVSFGPLVRNLLDSAGLVVPRDLAYVDLFLDGSDRRIAGIRENCERVGEIAIEILVAQMQQNLRGIPEVATVTSVECPWLDGDSLPQSGTYSSWFGSARIAGYSEKMLLAAP